jgi:hypothetical protein
VEQELAEGRGSRDRLASYKDDDGSAERGFKPRAPKGLGQAAQLLAVLVSPVRLCVCVGVGIVLWQPVGASCVSPGFE